MLSGIILIHLYDSIMKGSVALGPFVFVIDSKCHEEPYRRSTRMNWKHAKSHVSDLGTRNASDRQQLGYDFMRDSEPESFNYAAPRFLNTYTE